MRERNNTRELKYQVSSKSKLRGSNYPLLLFTNQHPTPRNYLLVNNQVRFPYEHHVDHEGIQIG